MKVIAAILIIMLSFGAAATRQTTGRNAFDENFNLDVALGNEKRVIPSTVLGISQPLTSGAGATTIWDNDFSITPLDSPEELFINSTNSADTTQIFTVVGLDSDYDAIILQVTLNGLTPVSLGTLGHVQFVNLSGTSTTPLGDVFVARSSTLVAGVPLDEDVLSRVPQGENVTHNGFTRIPRGKFGVLISFRGSTDADVVVISILRRFFGATDSVTASRFHIAKGTTELTFPLPGGTFVAGGVVRPIFDEKMFIEYRVTTSSPGIPAEAIWVGNYFLIDKEYIGLQ